VLRLETSEPFEASLTVAVLSAHAIPGAEQADPAAQRYRRMLRVGPWTGPVAIAFARDHLLVEVDAPSVDLELLERRIRAWFDLDADLEPVRQVLSEDSLLAPAIRRRPGLRLIGHPDGFEALIGAVLGQQVTLAAGRTFAARLLTAYGTRDVSGLMCFPSAERLAGVAAHELRETIGLTGSRASTLLAVAKACADGLAIDAEGDGAEIRRRLLALPGIGPWTVDYLGLRALRESDAFPAGDLVIRRALGGIPAKQAMARSRPWSPYRAYAAFHLWAAAYYER